jgi:hypothetical protein
MANVQAPFGFAHIGYLEGASPSQGNARRKIASGNATAIFFGDPVVSLSTGYIARATAGTTQIAGIFLGCKYLSTSQQRTVWSRYWPGSDAAADAECYIQNAPGSLFLVQAGGSTTPIGFANINENANFGLGTGSTSTGNSGAFLDQTTLNPATTTLPFRVVDNILDPPGANGADITTGYNLVTVTFNWQDFKSTAGI